MNNSAHLRKLSAFALLCSAAATLPCAAGTLYVDDFTGIYRYSADGSQRTVFSTQGGAAEIAFNSSGQLYGNYPGRLYTYSSLGTRSTFALRSNAQGVVIDSSDNIYTGAAGNVYRYTPDGASSVFVGNSYAVNSLALQPSTGTIYDLDANGFIARFASNGTLLNTFSTTGTTRRIAVDGSGNAYVGNWETHTLDKYSTSGTHSTFFTLPDPSSIVQGMAFDYSTNTMYVSTTPSGSLGCCSGNIYAVASDGSSSLFASGLYLPMGLAILDTPASETPEPATWVTLAAGIAGALVRRRFRRG